MTDLKLSDDTNKIFYQTCRYYMGHSSLCIQAEDEHNVLYIWFGEVKYFSGPIKWIGGNFQIDYSEKCIDILRKMGGFEKLDDELLAENFKLYYINLDILNVEIIASEMSVSLDEPSP